MGVPTLSTIPRAFATESTTLWTYLVLFPAGYKEYGIDTTART
jgi:hypothetical protein